MNKEKSESTTIEVNMHLTSEESSSNNKLTSLVLTTMSNYVNYDDTSLSKSSIEMNLNQKKKRQKLDYEVFDKRRELIKSTSCKNFSRDTDTKELVQQQMYDDGGVCGLVACSNILGIPLCKDYKDNLSSRFVFDTIADNLQKQTHLEVNGDESVLKFRKENGFYHHQVIFQFLRKYKINLCKHKVNLQPLQKAAYLWTYLKSCKKKKLFDNLIYN
jgi:hypothetical protein